MRLSAGGGDPPLTPAFRDGILPASAGPDLVPAEQIRTGDSLFPELSSYCHGASDVPFIGDTAGGSLDRAAREHPDSEALVSCVDGLRFTYSQLRLQVDHVARGLIAMGVQRRDRIGIWSGNSPQWVIAWYAAAKIGAILVGI